MDKGLAKYDIVIIGAGVLGLSTAYWFSKLYDCSLALIDKEDQVAFHTSSRNTGVVHRPFYLDPQKKKVFAASAQKSYYLWKEMASKYNLPWNQAGTLEVATSDADMQTLERYKKWAALNGMDENEVEILDKAEVEKLEPEVKCDSAFFSKTDTSVDYGVFSRTLFEIIQKRGVVFLPGFNVQGFSVSQGIVGIQLRQKADPTQTKSLSCRFMINLAGGGSIDIAHEFGLAKQYTDLHFRGEYWVVDRNFGSKINHQIYSVPKFKEFPFLDPHFIVRASGKREIGPNAVLVFGPHAYKGVSENKTQIVKKIFERPLTPKLKLFTNKTFLSLVWHESRSSLSKDVMCERVTEFVPALNPSLLTEKGFAGVRSSVIDNSGFVPEAIEIYDDNSLHVLNYNSPGATGAPAFSAHLVSQLQSKGHLAKWKKISNGHGLWDSVF